MKKVPKKKITLGEKFPVIDKHGNEVDVGMNVLLPSGRIGEVKSIFMDAPLFIDKWMDWSWHVYVESIPLESERKKGAIITRIHAFARQTEVLEDVCLTY